MEQAELNTLVADRQRLEADLLFRRGQLEASRMYVSASQQVLDSKYRDLDVWISRRTLFDSVLPLLKDLETTKAQLEQCEMDTATIESGNEAASLELQSLMAKLAEVRAAVDSKQKQIDEERQRENEAIASLERDVEMHRHRVRAALASQYA
jgi:regulator of replication initiation timing